MIRFESFDWLAARQALQAEGLIGSAVIGADLPKFYYDNRVTVASYGNEVELEYVYPDEENRASQVLSNCDIQHERL